MDRRKGRTEVRIVQYLVQGVVQCILGVDVDDGVVRAAGPSQETSSHDVELSGDEALDGKEVFTFQDFVTSVHIHARLFGRVGEPDLTVTVTLDHIALPCVHDELDDSVFGGFDIEVQVQLSLGFLVLFDGSHLLPPLTFQFNGG